ncbi:MAG: ZIP family metal transporter [Candidatus Berkelbacteria bacterium]|nr:ZIP family metal transporter [Candidatus Berkelbacteria bacterium]
MLIFFGILAFVATLLGGLFALRFKDKLHLILGFSAGAVLGVALFDLLPESIELAKNSYQTSFIATLIGIGFVIFLILDRMFLIHGHCEDGNCENEKHKSGFHGALTLAVHSFLDGFGIGLAFKVSPAVGIIVAVAVLAHDFSDGINTVNYILKNKGRSKTAFSWLIIDALAPVLGILATFFFTISQSTLGLILAVFCGFFLYIGASDLLPESHHRHPRALTTVMTIVGMAVIYTAIKLAM